MVQLYFRDLRRRLESLEQHYFPELPTRVALHFVDENDVPYLSIYPGAEQPEVRYPPLGPEDYATGPVNHSAAPPQQTGAGRPTAPTQPTSSANTADPAQESSAAPPLSSAPPGARRPGFFVLAPAGAFPEPAADPPYATHRPRNRRRPTHRCRHGARPAKSPRTPE